MICQQCGKSGAAATGQRCSFPATSSAVVVIAGATIWGLFGTFLILQLTGLPPVLYRTAMTLLVAEFIALMMDDLGSPAVAAAGHSAAMVDVPLLAVALVVVAIMRAVRPMRRKIRR